MQLHYIGNCDSKQLKKLEWKMSRNANGILHLRIGWCVHPITPHALYISFCATHFFFFRFVTVCSFVCLCFIVIYFSMRRKVLAFVISFGFFRLKQLLTVGAFIARKMKMWHKKGLIRKFTEKKRANAFNCLVGNQ